VVVAVNGCRWLWVATCCKAGRGGLLVGQQGGVEGGLRGSGVVTGCVRVCAWAVHLALEIWLSPSHAHTATPTRGDLRCRDHARPMRQLAK